MSDRAVVIEPSSARSIEVKQGEVLRVEDLDGGQVADFVCFSLHDYGERFSQAKTRVRNWTTEITTGSELISNRDNVMFTLCEDRVGVHDIVFCPCHSWVYENIYKVGARNGCFENLSMAVSDFGIPSDNVPAPFNIFMNTDVRPDGELVLEACPSKQGDYLDMRAEMDCLVAVSACADDISDCNNGKCKRIRLDIV